MAPTTNSSSNEGLAAQQRFARFGAAFAFACASVFSMSFAIADAPTDGVHVVAKGQTLRSIAKRYHTSVESLRDVNQLNRREPIRPGLSLVIPEKGKEGEATKRAALLRDQTSRPKLGASPSGLKQERAEKNGRKPRDVFVKKPKRPGYVRLVRGAEHVDVQLLSRGGHLMSKALPQLGRILKFYPTNTRVSIDPRLATLVGLVSDHFGGRPIHVVSGYRPYSPAQYTPHSNHNFGRAIDFSVDGVPSTLVIEYCRTFHNAGVGYYPHSTFVHLDARVGKAYWIDYSEPGQPPQYDPAWIHGAADEAARDVLSEGDVATAPSAVPSSAPTLVAPSEPEVAPSSSAVAP